MMRPSVVLPVPLGPMSATLAPSPTRSETSLEQRPAVGQDEAHGVDVEVSHEGPCSGIVAAPSRAFHGWCPIGRTARPMVKGSTKLAKGQSTTASTIGGTTPSHRKVLQ